MATNQQGRDFELEGIVDGHVGVFGDAVSQHDTVTNGITRTGIEFVFACGGCGRPTKVEIEWPEFVAMKYGIDPALAFRGRSGILSGEPLSWQFDPKESRWKPVGDDAKCKLCLFHFTLRLSSDEPERFLAKGRQARVIDPVGEQRISQLCAAVAQQLSGRVR